MIIKIITAFAVGTIIGNPIAKHIKTKYLEKTHSLEKHFCNDCQLAYITNTDEITYKYCPYCGKRLTRHKYYLNKEEI